MVLYNFSELYNFIEKKNILGLRIECFPVSLFTALYNTEIVLVYDHPALLNIYNLLELQNEYSFANALKRFLI